MTLGEERKVQDTSSPVTALVQSALQEGPAMGIIRSLRVSFMPQKLPKFTSGRTVGNVESSILGRCKGAEEEVGCKSVPLSNNPPSKCGLIPHSAGHNLIWVPALYLTISQLVQVSRTSPFWRLNNPFKGNLCTLCPQRRSWQCLAQRLLCEGEFGPWSCFWIRMLDIRRQLSMVPLCSEHVMALLRRAELKAIKLPRPSGIHESYLVPPSNPSQQDPKGL